MKISTMSAGCQILKYKKNQRGDLDRVNCPESICLIQGNRCWFRIETSQILAFKCSMFKAESKHFRLKDQIKRYWFFHSEFNNFNEALRGWDISLILYNFRYLLIFKSHQKDPQVRRRQMGCEAKAAPDSQRLSASGGPRPSMCFPHTMSSRVPARMITSGIRITLQRPIFTKSRRSWQRRRKNHTRAVDLPMPNFPDF